MAQQGQNEGFHVLEDFVCDAIPDSAVTQASREKQGQNEGARVIAELVFEGKSAGGEAGEQEDKGRCPSDDRGAPQAGPSREEA